MPPGRSVSPPSPNNATTLSHTRSTRYRSCEITTSVPGHESSRSSSCCSVSMSRSLVGSSSSSTFGSAISSRRSCNRRRSPPDRSDDRRPLLLRREPEPLRAAATRTSPACRARRGGRSPRSPPAPASTPSRSCSSWLRCASLHGLALDALAGLRLAFAGEQPQQRRLAGAVDADQPDPVAGPDAPRQVLHQHAVSPPTASRPPARSPCGRACASRTPAAPPSHAAAARPRSAPRRPRYGSAAWTCAREHRGAARPAPCGPGCGRFSSSVSARRARSARAKIQSA